MSGFSERRNQDLIKLNELVKSTNGKELKSFNNITYTYNKDDMSFVVPKLEK
jgi:hypothetical protein